MTSGIGFLDLARVVVPRRLADVAQGHLRAVGQRGCEGFALWAGRLRDDAFVVEETIIPRQSGLHVNGGVCVTVGGDELFRINRHLYERRLSLIAQIHSHPSEAYHSYTDDSYPIATTIGALSLVVPDFAARPFALEDTAIYRLCADGIWEELTYAAACSLIQLTA